MPANPPRFGPVAKLVRLANRSLFVLAAARLFYAAEAQEALSVSLAGERAARNRKYARELQPYTFKTGEAEVRLGGSLATEWNDNITLVEQDTISDTIFRPQVKADVSWPITTANYLEASIAAGYSKYLSHSEFDRPFILPGSALRFDVFLRDVKLTFEDRFTYQQDSAERAVVTGTAEFGGLDNVAGVQALADWNDANLSASYHHRLFVSMVPEYDYLDRSSHQFFSRFTLKPRPDLHLGTEAGLTPTDYFDSYLRDNLSYSGGVFAEWKVSPHLSVNGRGGVVFFHYDQDSGAPSAGRSLPGGRPHPLSASSPGDPQDVRSFYFNLGVSHRLRKALSVSLDVGQDSQQGVNDDLTEQFYIRHGVDWTISRQISATGNLVYENGTESGTMQTESFSRLSLKLAGSWQWSRRWNARLSWRFIARDSEQPQRGYDNHRVVLDIGYQW
jgi:hypothetical protein